MSQPQRIFLSPLQTGHGAPSPNSVEAITPRLNRGDGVREAAGRWWRPLPRGEDREGGYERATNDEESHLISFLSSGRDLTLIISERESSFYSGRSSEKGECCIGSLRALDADPLDLGVTARVQIREGGKGRG